MAYSTYTCLPDIILHHLEPSSSSFTPPTSSQLRCANYGIQRRRIRQRRHILNIDAILVQIQQQVASQIMTSNDYICDACHIFFVDRDPTMLQDNQDAPIVGHQHVCVLCGCSVVQIESHSVGAESHSNILDVQQWIHPREIQPSDLLCHRCFQRANTTAVNNILAEPAVNTRKESPCQITLEHRILITNVYFCNVIVPPK